MSRRSAALSMAFAGMLLCASARAGTLKVPADFPTIQAAVDAAVEGDTVLVSKGTYVEAVDVVDKTGVTLRGKGKVVMDATNFNTAITILFCTGVEVRGITVCDCREHAFVVACSSDVVVRKCRAIGGDLDGIRVYSGTDCRLERNLVKDVANIGIRVLEQQPDEPGGPGVPCSGPEGVVLFRNKIEHPGGDGIHVSGVGHVVEKNRVIDAGGDGIVSLAGDSGTLFRRNRIVGVGARGLVVNGPGESLEKNRIKKPNGVGLLIEAGADGASLLGDRVVKPAKSGFALLATGVTCTGTRVIKSGEDAFVAGGSGNAFDSCRATHAAFLGFYVTAETSTFTECRATDSGLLDLQDAAAGESTNTYIDCKFETSNLP